VHGNTRSRREVAAGDLLSAAGIQPVDGISIVAGVLDDVDPAFVNVPAAAGVPISSGSAGCSDWSGVPAVIQLFASFIIAGVSSLAGCLAVSSGPAYFVSQLLLWCLCYCLRPIC
jgi:hypothetical protein